MAPEKQCVAALELKANKGPLSDRRPQDQAESVDHTPLPEVRLLLVASIRTDGETQHRIAPDAGIVREYAELMRAGVVFPPVDVRWDGADYWLSDGFQRTEAAKLANHTEIPAHIRGGTRCDAQWDSYAANATHGLRRTAAETETIVQLALHHPNATKLSNVQLAKHLHVSEPTVRRWRAKLSSSGDEDRIRTVTRDETTYDLNITNIGRNGGAWRPRSHRCLRLDLAAMKENSSAAARPLLVIIEHWVLGQSEPARCLDAIERFLGARHPDLLEASVQGQPSPLLTDRTNPLRPRA